MTIFLRRGSLRLVNQSSVPTLIKTVQKGDPDGDGHGTSQSQLSANNAQTVLTFISHHCPSLYKPHVTELVKAIADEKNSRLVEVALQALSALTQWDKSLIPTDKSVICLGVFVDSDGVMIDDSAKEFLDSLWNLVTDVPSLRLAYCAVPKTRPSFALKLLMCVSS